ncbi:MAG TPA: hypothetical protein VMV35_00710 [Halothiobacillus sp.]|nr:hypothetical protein [Halothiobacillus sp.]
MTTKPMKPRQVVFWRSMGRFVPLATLLLLLWGYVLPYQAGVQIDKALAVWVNHHDGWHLTRQRVGVYERRYQIRWGGSSGSPPILATLQVQNRPVGWSTGAGHQWGWGAFSLSLDPASAVQLTRWPDETWRWVGIIGWLGGLDMHLPMTSPKSGSAQLKFDARSGRWQGQLDLPAWRLTTPANTWRFGRSIIDLDLRSVADTPLDSDSILPFGGLLGEVGVDIRRLGWVGPQDRGLVDGLHLRFRQISRQQGNLRDVIGSASVEAVQYQGKPLGSAQTTIALYDAEPEVISRLYALGSRVVMMLPDLRLDDPTQPLLDGFAQARVHDAWSEVLIALRRAEVRLDAFRFHGPHGGFDAAGAAFGPRYQTDLSRGSSRRKAVRYWRANLGLQVDAAWLCAWPSDLTRIWQPWLQRQQGRWVGNFEHTATGWQIQKNPADISTFRPQD